MTEKNIKQYIPWNNGETQNIEYQPGWSVWSMSGVVVDTVVLKRWSHSVISRIVPFTLSAGRGIKKIPIRLKWIEQPI